MIDIDFDESQLELQSAARRLFAGAGGPGLARARLEEGAGFPHDLWQTMVELGFPGIAIAEEHGGAGGGLVDHVAIALETGRAVIATPLVPSGVVAAHMLGAVADDRPEAAVLLRGIATGEAIVIPAILETAGTWDEDGIDTRLDGGRLSGVKVLVPFTDVATRLLVAARGDAGVALVLVDPGAPGVSVDPVDNLAALPLATVTFAEVEVGPADVVATPGEGLPVLAAAVARGAVLRAAEVAGAGEEMLDLAVDYAQQREQFGTPIGVHQAVQYLCTDVAIESHLTGLLARRAAWLLDAGLPADRAVAAAKRYASQAAAHMAQQAHEVFAGMAYMMEHDLHLFTRQAKYWEYDLGDARHHGDRLVDAVEAELG